MSNPTDTFRDIGIHPHEAVSAPAQIVTAYFPWGHVVGQYLATFLFSGIGIGLGIVMAIGLQMPLNILAGAFMIALMGWLVFKATHNDYTSIELAGDMIRAKHLYTRKVIVRSIREIAELRTVTLPVKNAGILIAEALIGRVRGVMIQFKDQRSPLLISRKDPTMRNARELVEAIIYRMSEQAEIDAELIDLDGKPLVRRIFWKKSDH